MKKYILSGALLLSLMLAGSLLMPSPVVAEGHPKIHAALRELRNAKVELENAAHDFNGHKKDAIAAVQGAIDQLELCVK